MGILRTNEISGLETPTAVTGSVSFDGSGDYLSLADGPDLELGNGDFTIEGWFYFENTGSSGTNFWGKWNSPNRSYAFSYVKSTGTYIFGYSTDGSAEVLLTSDALSADTRTWIHIAAVRSGSSLKVYKNGTAIINSSVGTATFYNATTDLYIGRLQSNTNYDYDGYISNFRILKGTALYTSDFTPPVHELQRIGDTVLLCCNNPDSAGAEATGKTITVNGNAAASTFSPGLTRDFTSGTQFEGVAKFDTQGYFVPPSGTTEQRGGTRGLTMGGLTSNSISYIQVQTQGNAQDFGDLSSTVGKYTSAAFSSSTRSFCAGGEISPGSSTTDAIEFVYSSTTGNVIDFGNLLGNLINAPGGLANSTRGVVAGGYNPSPAASRINTIQYITMASSGNAQTFGELANGEKNDGLMSFSSPTRGIFAGGNNTPAGTINSIHFITIASTGNASDFGDLTTIRTSNSSCSNSTRGLVAGSAPVSYEIEFVTIASTGNAQEFGDLLVDKNGGLGGMSSLTRGVFAGGANPTAVNIIDFVEIATTGTSKDFGDLIEKQNYTVSTSNGHGGLS